MFLGRNIVTRNHTTIQISNGSYLIANTEAADEQESRVTESCIELLRKFENL
jgi:hypothetical protein